MDKHCRICHNTSCSNHGKNISFLGDGWKCNYIPVPTNADRIRSMSDDELAEFLWDFNLADVSTVKMGEFGPHMFRYRLKEWLQQPAEGIAEADLKGSDG